MNEKNLLGQKFEADRPRLKAVAYRMLGSSSDAEDAVQETWLRLSRADSREVENLSGWLTTVVARVCLDALRSRKSRREDPLDAEALELLASGEKGPGEDIEMADSIGLALLVVLETLSPAERVAFVLHDMFDLPFEDIARVVNRTPEAARQLASRARRRVRGAEAKPRADRSRHRKIVEAFLAAARANDFAGLLAALDPEVVFRADAVAAAMGSQPEMRGAEAVANSFKGRAQAAEPALVDGDVGVTVAFGGKLRIVLKIEIAGDRIVAIAAVADPQDLARFRIAPF